MPDTILELVLDGDVTLKQFTDAMVHFQALINNLAQEISPNTNIDWDLENLTYGSAIVTVSGRADNIEPILHIVEAFEEVGESLQNNKPIPFPASVIREAHKLTSVIGDGVQSVRLGTPNKESIIYGVFDTTLNKPKPIFTAPFTSFGTVKGRVQSISNRGKLRFTLYDAVFDKPISCYVTEDKVNTLTNIWDKIVFVTGKVTRQPFTGQPVSVREITSIDEIPQYEPGSYRQARGVLAGFDDEPAEVTIRRLRDAED